MELEILSEKGLAKLMEYCLELKTELEKESELLYQKEVE
jgi:hypothetical protein